MKNGYLFKKKSRIQEHSRRYTATICQIVGLAFCSSLASYIFNANLSNDFSEIIECKLGFIVSIMFCFIGIVLLSIGLFIMIELDRRKTNE